jgi:hypothetical protein
VDGAVTAGPAPRALRRLDLALEDGRLIVDIAKAAAPGAILKA